MLIPSGAQALNLDIADADKSKKKKTKQNSTVGFSTAIERWTVLKKHMKITVKTWITEDGRVGSRVFMQSGIRLLRFERHYWKPDRRSMIPWPLWRHEHLQRKLGLSASRFALLYGVRY